jgi:hypothetical protein
MLGLDARNGSRPLVCTSVARTGTRFQWMQRRLPCGTSGRTGNLVLRKRELGGIRSISVVQEQGAVLGSGPRAHVKPRGFVQRPVGRTRAFWQRNRRLRDK